MAIAAISRDRQAAPGDRRINAADRLIVALDVPTVEQARQLIDRLDGVVSFFKIGLQLQLAADSAFINSIVGQNKRVFLDYKYYDISRTVREAVAQAAKIGATFLTVHGNSAIVRAAVEGKGDSALKILSVTVLTNFDDDDLRELGLKDSVEDLVLRRAKLALEVGCDGVIASGWEARRIREVCGQDLLIVTPGVRPPGSSTDDQKRVVTPYEAVLAGADYLVVGRPIYLTSDPTFAAKKVIRDMQHGFDTRPEFCSSVGA